MTAMRDRSALRALLFTDLDGTLLDSRTYETDAAARDLLCRLEREGHFVVFCSSKTWAEQAALCEGLEFRPSYCVVENGAAIIAPGDSGRGRRVVAALGVERTDIQIRLNYIEQRRGVAFRGYARIGAKEVSRLSGLSLEAAKRAVEREYSETLVDRLPAKEWDVLAPIFAEQGLQCAHGGRFHTVTEAGVDKGRAVRVLKDRLERELGATLVTAGLGDSPNDASMLAAVDFPILVQQSPGHWMNCALPRVCRIAATAPSAWSLGVEGFLRGLRERTNPERLEV